MTQAHALSILKTGRNAFITGPAGAGKTHVVNRYIKYLKDHNVVIGVTASTGIAATHMGGITLHSWSGMGIKDDIDEYDLETLAEKPQLVRRFKETRVLIIDEVSMLHHFHLDMVDKIARKLRARPDEPFGGLQVVLCGDFFQLPPVSKYGQASQFIYRSQAWRDGAFAVCYLSENHRQKDDPLLSILNEIRDGEVTEGSREELKGRYRIAGGTKASGEKAQHIEIDVDADIARVPTRLYTHNEDVDAINEAELARVDGREHRFNMSSRGKKPLIEALIRSCLAPETLRLKEGARVMCVKNNFEQGYVNGTLGTVVSCPSNMASSVRTEDRGIVIVADPSPDWPSGRELTIEPATWSIADDGKVLAEIVQYPLRLAWAITVHKSQGMSLDAAGVDLSRSFEPGMGYVALSRVRRLSGLSILGMSEAAFKVHPEVLEYDLKLREVSGKEESILEGTDVAELKRTEDEFLAKVAPMHKLAGKDDGKGKRKDEKSKRGIKF